ncbi:MAG: BBP7 family outer membrane beta-barrel protein [Gemmataceae bacterium]
MNHRWLAAVGGCLTSVGLAVAAPLASPTNLPLSLPAAETVPATKDVGPPGTGTVVLPSSSVAAADGCSTCAPPACGNGCGCGAQFWGSADYLLWWIKGAPLPIPLVSTGDPTAALPGVIGQPGTRVLLGNQEVDTSTRSGFRLNAGGYLDSRG